MQVVLDPEHFKLMMSLPLKAEKFSYLAERDISQQTLFRDLQSVGRDPLRAPQFV
jgi:hypothetical protein